jgi:hypothetical protein
VFYLSGGEYPEVASSVDSEVSVSALQQLDVMVAQQLARPRFLATLFSGLGCFAGLLGIVGLYAVIAATVKQREHEIAVRMAVGADGRKILGLFMNEGSQAGVGRTPVGNVRRVCDGTTVGSPALRGQQNRLSDAWTRRARAGRLRRRCHLVASATSQQDRSGARAQRRIDGVSVWVQVIAFTYSPSKREALPRLPAHHLRHQ